MPASTAYAASPRPAAGVRGSGLRVQEEFCSPKASLSQGLKAQAPKPASPQALPPGVHLGRTSIEPLRRLPSQLDVIDDLLDGGLPRGRVSELVGTQSSGKTSLLISFLAAATRRSEVTAYVDLADSLDPQSFAAAGVDFERLLWVRPPSLKDAVRCAEIILQAGGFAAVALDFGLSQASSHKNDAGASVISSPHLASPGGRGIGTTSHERLPRFRLNVWPRLARAAERSQASLIVLAPQRVTGSVATLGIETQARALWSGTPSPAFSRERAGVRVWPLFDGFDVSVTVARSKLGPPGRSGRWLVAGG